MAGWMKTPLGTEVDLGPDDIVLDGGPARLLDNSRICQLADCQLVDWTTHGLDISRTGQLADWATRGCHQRLYVLSFRSFGGICETASCPVCEMTSARVV